MTMYPRPTLGTTQFKYDGQKHAPAIQNFDQSVMELAGTKEATQIGVYAITVSLIDKSANIWADGTTDDVMLTWSIIGNQLVSLKQLEIVKNYIDVNDAKAIKSVKIEDNSLKFYTTTDKSGTAAFTVPLADGINYASNSEVENLFSLN